MPVFAGNNNDSRDGIAVKSLDLFHRHFGDFSFFLLATGVPVFQLFQKLASFDFVFAQKKF